MNVFSEAISFDIGFDCTGGFHSYTCDALGDLVDCAVSYRLR